MSFYKYCNDLGLSMWTFLYLYEDAPTWSSNLSTLCQLKKLLRLMPTNNQLNEVKPIRLFCILNAWNSPKRLFIALAIFKNESNRFILYLNIKSKRKVGSLKHQTVRLDQSMSILWRVLDTIKVYWNVPFNGEFLEHWLVVVANSLTWVCSRSLEF